MSGITNKILECRSSAETPRTGQTSGRASGARSRSTGKGARAKTTKSSRKSEYFRNNKKVRNKYFFQNQQRINSTYARPVAVPNAKPALIQKYEDLVGVIEELGKDVRPTYAGSKR